MAPRTASPSAIDQLAAEFTSVHAYLFTLARRSRGGDSREAHLEMVAHTWVELCRRLQHRSAMSQKELRREAVNCFRIGRRNFLAGEAHLTITGYQQFVSLLRIRYAGGVAPLGDLDLADLCWVYNNDGSDEDVARRRAQGRFISIEQAALLLLGHRRAEVDLTSRADGRAYQPEASCLRLDIIRSLESMGTASGGATALVEELRKRLIQDPFDVANVELRNIAEEVGLRGGSRDRAIAEVRRHLRRELSIG